VTKGNPYKHRYKHGKLKKAIDLKVFKRMMEEAEQIKRGSYSILFIQSLLAILYWSGLRKSEIVGAISHKYETEKGIRETLAVPGIRREDVWVKDDFLCIKAVARKHGKREAPLMVPRSLAYVDLIERQWQEAKPKHRVWPVSEVQAWRLVKRLAPNLYLHFFRFNRITKFANNPKMSLAQICSWTGLSPQTVDSYLERSGRFTKEVGAMMTEET